VPRRKKKRSLQTTVPRSLADHLNILR